MCAKFGKRDANMVPKVTALHSKAKLFPLRQMLTCANYGIYVATCKLCREQYVGQTSNKFSKRWNSNRSSWNTVNSSNDQEQVPLLHHVVHEHKIEKKPKINGCFVVTFVEQPSYDTLIFVKKSGSTKSALASTSTELFCLALNNRLGLV